MTKPEHVVSEVATIATPTSTQPLSMEHSATQRRWNEEKNGASVLEKCYMNKDRLCVPRKKGSNIPSEERQSYPKITKLGVGGWRGLLFPGNMASLFAA